jgi:hypothetical protein
MTVEQAPGSLYPEIENNFKYHTPNEHQIKIYADLRETGKKLAYKIKDYAGAYRETSLAITKLEEAIMWANASIARNYEPRID